jgi:hypothetical protein
VRPAHHHRHSGGAHRVGHPVGFRHHPRHRADADESDALLANVGDEFLFVHRVGIAVDEQHFMAGRRQRLQQKHPEMRHEVARHPVIGVV